KKGYAAKFKALFLEEYNRLVEKSKTGISSSETDKAIQSKSDTASNDASNPIQFLDVNHVITILESCDKSGYRLCDWLYQNDHQNISNDIFSQVNSEISPDPEERQKNPRNFKLAILCNQENYIKENSSVGRSTISYLLKCKCDAIQLG